MQSVTWRQPLVIAAVAWPWLWPLASGPWPAAQQAIWSLGCAGVLLAMRGPFWAGFGGATAAGWLLAAGLSAAIGLVQYLGWSSVMAPWINVTDAGEAFGNLRQRNQFASLSALGLAVLLWHRSSSPIGPQPAAMGSRVRPQALAWMALAGLLGAANAASGSRTGMLQGLLLAMLVWIWRGPDDRDRRWLLYAAVVAYVMAAAVLPLLLGLNPAERGIAGRLRSDGIACGSRWILWSNVLHLIAQRPWTGWGWGELDYAHFMARYPDARFCEILDNAHNLPLHLAVELGVPLALVVCGAALWAFLRARPWAERDAQRRMAWAVLAVVLLHSLLEYPLWYGPFQLATGCALCLLLVRQPAPGLPAGPAQSRLQVGAGALGAALILAALYAAWDYHRVSQIYLAPERRDAYYQSRTMDKIRDSWLFGNQVRFAELVTTDVDRSNAAHVRDLAAQLLHFSPEPRVVERLIESSVLLGDDAQAALYLSRYRTAFPKEHAAWASRRLLDAPAAQGAQERPRP